MVRSGPLETIVLGTLDCLLSFADRSFFFGELMRGCVGSCLIDLIAFKLLPNLMIMGRC